MSLKWGKSFLRNLNFFLLISISVRKGRACKPCACDKQKCEGRIERGVKPRSKTIRKRKRSAAIVRGSDEETEAGTSKKAKSVAGGSGGGDLGAKDSRLDVEVSDWREEMGKMRGEIVGLRKEIRAGVHSIVTEMRKYREMIERQGKEKKAEEEVEDEEEESESGEEKEEGS